MPAPTGDSMTKRTRTRALDERGMAAVMALIVILALSLLVSAFMAVSAFEPQISQNLADSTQARFAADAGIEWAFDQMVATTSWNTLLTGAVSCAASVTPAGWNNVTVAGLAGSFTVSVRNDCQAGDDQITGVAVDNVTGTATNDGNGILIVTATGTYPAGAATGAQKRIQVVINRTLATASPTFPGAVNEPGFQSDTFVACAGNGGSCANFGIDGRDHSCSSCTTDAAWYNNANWSAASGPPQKLGIATQTGNQQNLSPATSYEQNVESAFTSGTSGQVSQKEGDVVGKDQGTGALTTGLNTIAASNALNPTTMQNFLNTLAANPKTQILQSTMACPMQITGGSGTATSTPTLTNGCGMNQTLNLGTPSNPQLVYFRGDLDTSSMFTGLTVNNQIQGAGILVVEDGDMKLLGNLNWQGAILVTGRYVGTGFMNGSTTNINGAFVSNETIWNEAAGFYEVYLGTTTGSANFQYSQQALDMMKTIRAFHTIYGWRAL
jgi:Tfp pilus assembly protein PilX